MQEELKKSYLATWLMMAGVLVMGVVAFAISERHGYGASSEAKMNFLRLIVLVVSLVQIAMAGAMKKIISASAVHAKNANRFFAAQLTANILCEAPAVFGLILVFISKTFMDFAILGGVSLIALILFFPKQSLPNQSLKG